MARTFSYQLSTPHSPEEARAQIGGALAQRLRDSAGLGLSDQTGDSLSFKPRLRFPVVWWAYRRLSGESVNVSFTPEGDGTRVSVAGKLRGDAEAAADREFWDELLSTS